MANQKHLDILKQGVDVWNQWRKAFPDIRPDLSDADFNRLDLSGGNLSGVNLRGANLRWAKPSEKDMTGADLIKTNLRGADLRGANLSDANLSGINLSNFDFSETDLCGADLSGTDLRRTNFSAANLSSADLTRAIIVETNLENAVLTNCSIYGIAAWDVQLAGAKQEDLVITLPNQPTITVDNLEVAQFIYLLLNNKEIRDVIDTITSKVVLILGRFTPKRKAILDALKEELRKHNYTPVLFDFERPTNRDFTETARTLAHLSRFILADITEPSSIPQELQAIVPDLEVPVQPLLEENRKEYSMFPDFGKYPWVAPVYLYKDQVSLISSFYEKIITPIDEKARELAVAKAKRLKQP